jgi:Fe-S cluster assembly protein SufD
MNWAAKVREAGGARAQALGIPGPRHEAWRLIDASALNKPVPAREGNEASIESYILPDAARIVFVDGRYSEGLSSPGNEPNLKVCPLGLEGEALHEHFGRMLDEEYYAQLNAQHFADCAFVHVKGEASQPIHVLHVGTQGTNHARILVVVEDNARATLIEEYVGAGFTNAVTEVVLGNHASLRHIRIQEDAELHVGNAGVKLATAANYDSTQLSLGGRLSRHYLHLKHAGEHGEALLDGLNLSDGRQVVDTHTRVDHLVPECRTVQRHKCIAAGTSISVFSGNIVVHKGAKGTDTKQESRNLLLSGRAKIDAQPELEILNDDVSCKHGATVGQIDPEELFYLQSRGLNMDASRKLLIYAFAAQIVDRIPVPALAARLKETMTGRLA